MKILWASNAPWVASGYGNQTGLFLPRIKALGHDIHCLGFYGHQGMPAGFEGITVFGSGMLEHGVDMVEPLSEFISADITITLYDAWVYEPLAWQKARWVPWFPVDMEPMPKAVERAIKKAYKRIVFTRFGERMVHDAGLDCYYVPHGIDTNQYKPWDKAECRKALHWPQDRYIVGIVAANKGQPSRKAFTQQIAAFAEFKKRHPEAALYLHTMMRTPNAGHNTGVDLPEFIESVGLSWSVEGADGWHEADVWFSSQFYTLYGFLPQYMTQMYSSLDVFMLVSMGEGFGIPIVEAQACGAPVIVGDWTAMSELCFSGQLVPRSEADKVWTPVAAYQFSPRVGAIVEALEAEYKQPSDRQKARWGAMEYDANLVASKYWKPVLDEIAEGLK